MPARSASSSWVIPDASRICLSDPARVSVTGLTVTQNGDVNGGFVSWCPAAPGEMIPPTQAARTAAGQLSQGENPDVGAAEPEQANDSARVRGSVKPGPARGPGRARVARPRRALPVPRTGAGSRGLEA